MIIKTEISLGELFDKISILSIKLEKLKNQEKINEVKKEYEILLKKAREFPHFEENISKLKTVNLILWEVEDAIRGKEYKKEFDGEFIQLARKVYFTNDKRFSIKNEINKTNNSEIKEQKEYEFYK